MKNREKITNMQTVDGQGTVAASECIGRTGGGTRRGADNVVNSGAVVAAPATC